MVVEPRLYRPNSTYGWQRMHAFHGVCIVPVWYHRGWTPRLSATGPNHGTREFRPPWLTVASPRRSSRFRIATDLLHCNEHVRFWKQSVPYILAQRADPTGDEPARGDRSRPGSGPSRGVPDPGRPVGLTRRQPSYVASRIPKDVLRDELV